MLVGRADEQAKLAACIDAALAGHGRLVLIGGEAGIGKTTLVYASGQSNVQTTIVGGRVVLDDGRIVGLDEGRILSEAQTLAEQLAITAGTRQRLDGRWPARRGPTRVLQA